MKLLVVDYDKDYMMVMGYIFQPDDFDMDITYISNPEDLEGLDCSRFDACMCDYSLGGKSSSSEVLRLIKSKGFKGRFVIIAISPEAVIVKDNPLNGGEITVMDKSKSSKLRALMQELTSEIPKAHRL